MRSQTSDIKQIEELNKEVIKQQRRLDNLYKALETGRIDIDDLAPRIRELRASIEGYRSQQLTLSQKLHEPIKPLTKRQLRAYVEDLRNLLAEGSIFEQKSFLESFIRRITVDGNSVVVTYTYPIKGGDGPSGNGGVLCSERLSTPGRTIIELFSRSWTTSKWLFDHGQQQFNSGSSVFQLLEESVGGNTCHFV